MTDRERFSGIMDYRRVDRLPLYWFGLWDETAARWRDEGWDGTTESLGLDPDWEDGMWSSHGLAVPGPLPTRSDEVVGEDGEYFFVRTGLGALEKRAKLGGTIPLHLEEALSPTREAWESFKRFLDPFDSRRLIPDLEETIARVNAGDRTVAILGGSFFGWPRDWMGLMNWSYLCYDDPVLYEEIIAYLADFFTALYEPVLTRARVDLVYFFEDCCGSTGPLLSPDTYQRLYHRHYRRSIDFYRAHGVRHILIDSDGKTDDLIPCWLKSGFDIIFPVEVGSWRTDPAVLRRRFGKDLRMMGGVDKHVIPLGEEAIRRHLSALRPLVEEGGFIPMPDHRVPPDCSLAQFRTYTRVFREVFA
ncbi:MAG: uroporphyrinogen decarboxylase family protein [Bacteroidota bacterium]